MRYTGRDETEETVLAKRFTAATKRAVPALAAVLLALTACESQPAMGPTPAPPPPGIDPAPPPPAAPPPLPATVGRWDGLYAGRATLTTAPGGNMHCQRHIAMSGFTVQDGRVSFERYRGRVDTRGQAHLTWRQNWITGQFSNRGFEGRLFQPYPGCRYGISLERVGAP